MSSHLHSLAALLAYTNAQGAENAEVDSGGVLPPTVNLADAIALFDSLPLEMQEKWLQYAERVCNPVRL